MAGFRFVKISGTVGKDGRNAYLDVVAVQELLNASLPDTPHHLAVDGHCGRLTVAAIEKAERIFIRAGPAGRQVGPSRPYTRRHEPHAASHAASDGDDDKRPGASRQPGSAAHAKAELDQRARVSCREESYTARAVRFSNGRIGGDGRGGQWRDHVRSRQGRSRHPAHVARSRFSHPWPVHYRERRRPSNAQGIKQTPSVSRLARGSRRSWRGRTNT